VSTVGESYFPVSSPNFEELTRELAEAKLHEKPGAWPTRGSARIAGGGGAFLLCRIGNCGAFFPNADKRGYFSV
jgi:hypothetical protein